MYEYLWAFALGVGPGMLVSGAVYPGFRWIIIPGTVMTLLCWQHYGVF